MFDGVKTGYTKSAGHCLVGSAVKDGMRLVAVVLGSEDNKRFNDVSNLMVYGFRYFKTEKLFTKNETIKSIEVIAGKKDKVNVYLSTITQTLKILFHLSQFTHTIIGTSECTTKGLSFMK